MPYRNTNELSPSVKNAIPSENGRAIFMNVVNSQIAAKKPESVAFASAWSTLQRDGYQKNYKGQWVKLEKRNVSDDAFTTEPAEEETISAVTPELIISPADMDECGPEEKSFLCEAIESIISTIIGKSCRKGRAVSMRDLCGQIRKVDADQRIVYGWASVVTEDGQSVVDTQGDVIAPEEMAKSADEFMLSVRTAKAMHSGSKVGEVIHSLPVTADLCKALGISSPREGWIIAMKIHDDAVWNRVKSGELGAFSIGGYAQERS